MSDRKMIGLPADVYERFVEYGDEGDTDLAIVRRILDTLSETGELRGRISDLVSNNEHLQTQVDDLHGELEADRQLANKQVDDYIQRIEALELELHDKQTAIVPAGGQVTLDSFGIKDIVEDARDMCGGDDPTCMKVASKMLDLKAHFASKAVDHEHDAEQNRLDREQKELDRKSKEEQAAKDREEKEKERQLKKELSYIKKGYIPKGDLDDLVDIGRIQPKNAKKSIGDVKKRVYAEAAEEETPVRSGLTEGEIDEEEWDE